MQDRINPKTGDRLSLLGFGCMRLPRNGTAIDEAASEKLFIHAIEQGVNYFDTAYVYPGSEVALGKFLAKGWRNKVFLATKLPHFLVKSAGDIDKYFNKQLERLQTNYIDYYLIHMISDMAILNKLLALGLKDWVDRRKKEGKIKRIGFSFHGAPAQFKLIIDAFDWDFCMIQYNYLDEHNQAGTAGLQYAAGKGIGVLIMEPLRGGKLVKGLPPDACTLFEKAEPGYTPAQWALRWVMNHPEVMTVLSGMNSMEQLKQNLIVAENTKPDSMSPDELVVIEKAKAILMRDIKIPCTACGYCMPCPAGVDIPACFSSYNEKYTLKQKFAWMYYMQNVGGATHYPAKASLCKNCGKCVKHCPQSIDIPHELAKVTSEFETPLFKLASAVMRMIMGGKKA